MLRLFFATPATPVIRQLHFHCNVHTCISRLSVSTVQCMGMGTANHLM